MNSHRLIKSFTNLKLPVRLFSETKQPYQNLLNSKEKVKLDMLTRNLKKRKHMPKVQRFREQVTQPLEPLTYKLQELPENHDNLVPLGVKEELPFFVERTPSMNLPIYRDYNHDRSIKKTVIRKIGGDIEALMKELQKICSNSPMEAKVGQIVIKGLHKEVISDYFTRLGF